MQLRSALGARQFRVTKTLAKLRHRFKWPGCRRNVEMFLHCCDACTGANTSYGKGTHFVPISKNRAILAFQRNYTVIRGEKFKYGYLGKCVVVLGYTKHVELGVMTKNLYHSIFQNYIQVFFPCMTRC